MTASMFSPKIRDIYRCIPAAPRRVALTVDLMFVRASVQIYRSVRVRYLSLIASGRCGRIGLCEVHRKFPRQGGGPARDDESPRVLRPCY